MIDMMTSYEVNVAEPIKNMKYSISKALREVMSSKLFSVVDMRGWEGDNDTSLPLLCLNSVVKRKSTEIPMVVFPGTQVPGFIFCALILDLDHQTHEPV